MTDILYDPKTGKFLDVPAIYHTMGDGAAVCPRCANSGDFHAEEIVGSLINYGVRLVYCDCCNNRIRSTRDVARTIAYNREFGGN